MNFTLLPQNRIPDGLLEFPLPVVQVLYEAEQPVVYLTRTKQGQEMLAYLADETAESQFVVLAPATQASVQRLMRGSVDLRDALVDSWMWLVKLDFQQATTEAWSVNVGDIAPLHLPRAGTPLLPEHRIAFSARAVGASITLGSVPCSVVAFVANAAKTSLKTILDHALAVASEGRPTDAQRSLYDLPVQRLRFASFEIGLAAPSHDLFPNDVVKEAVGDLRSGLRWAQDAATESGLGIEDENKAEAVLRATLALTPPGHGAITSVEIGGSWLKGERFVLTRESRSKVSTRLREMRAEEIVVLDGRIGEIDDDKLSFTLRDLPDSSAEKRGTFPEELLDDMRSHYFDEKRVQISGVSRRGKLRVTAVVAPQEDA